ncbi:MAG: hypothetical protein NTY48_06885 [Candidatus Diapherotrites archaeon]|nr:hypothetical protein [Candidatus Diapherotrites archaeon]
MDRLEFAQKFPYSDSARDFLKEMGIAPDAVSENAIKKAALMISRAFSNSVYAMDSYNPSKDFLEEEIIAFPVAKMFVSLMHAPNITEKFARMVLKNTFNYLMGTTSTKDLCQLLADDLKINYSLSIDPDFLAVVPLLDYLAIYFIDNELKLVNMPLREGKVFLNLNSFARFLAEKSYARVFDSLPIPQAQIPKKFHSLARSIDSQLMVIEKKNFDVKLAGKIDAALFPPCMSVLYSAQLEGKKLAYLERLTLASFLYQLGMQREDLLLVLSKSPDYKKSVAVYHVDRIFSKQLSAPGCKKILEYGLRVKECEKECTFKHPVQYYISKLRTRNRLKNYSGSDGKIVSIKNDGAKNLGEGK